ncbi:rhodanese-like domain-containing protein [Pseudonocardia sp. HH130630-07]
MRPPQEYAAGHIPGAVSIPADELERRLAEATTVVVAYCRRPH